MKIEFLQTESDIDQLIDFLYDAECFLIRDPATPECLPMSRESAKESLCADLLINGRNYRIGKLRIPGFLYFFSCGRKSHPRFAEQMSREPGVIYTDDSQNTDLLGAIRDFIKKKYSFQRYNIPARFRCWFAPGYQNLNTSYETAQFPASFCGGFILMSCGQDQVEQALDRLRQTLHEHPEFISTEIRFRFLHCDEEQTEVIAGIWLDRSRYGIELIGSVAKELAYENDRIRIIQEKRYETAFSSRGKTESSAGGWTVRVTVDQEWKGFGNFEKQQNTWLV